MLFRSFGLEHPHTLGGRHAGRQVEDDIFPHSGYHLRADTLADTAVFSTSKSNDASSEAASWKGTSCVRLRQHTPFAKLLFVQYCSWLATGSALRMACTPASASGRPTIQKKSFYSERRLRLQRSGFAFSYPWLLATVVDTRMPVQEREQWSDIYFEQVERDAWLTIPFVRLFQDDRRALLQPTVQKALRCWAWSMILSVVPVEFVHGRNRSRSHKHDLWTALPTKTAKQQPRYRKPSARDVMRSKTIALHPRRS